MTKNKWVVGTFGLAVVFGLTTAIHAQSSTVGGKWLVLPDGKSAITLLVLRQSGESITGQWAPPKGEASTIEDGKVAGDTFTFSFVQDKKRFGATFHMGKGIIFFDLIGPKKRGRPETIHGQAARGDG